MVQTDILTKKEYGFIIKCVLQGINSPSQIHKAYNSNYPFHKVQYNEITNKLSKITNMYKFLYKDKQGRIAHYFINYSYWFEFMDRYYFKNYALPKIKYHSKKLIELFEKYLLNNLNNPVSIYVIIKRFIVHTGFANIKNPVSEFKKLKIQNLSFTDLIKNIPVVNDKSVIEYSEIQNFLLKCMAYVEQQLLWLVEEEVKVIKK